MELVPICDQAGQPLEDVETPAASRAALRAFYQQIRRAKLAGEKVHLSIAGGRKTMALFGLEQAIRTVPDRSLNDNPDTTRQRFVTLLRLHAIILESIVGWC